MSQTVITPQRTAAKTGFSIGICAADSGANLHRLLGLILTETYPSSLTLSKVVLVASGCKPESMIGVRALAQDDQRFVLIEEPTRRGKAAAINRIMEQSEGEFLVLVNSDALPESGAIAKLLSLITQDETVGMVSASPIVAGRAGVTGRVLQLMWATHNECLLTLSESDRNNHCCDELTVARSKALCKLPPGTVNDGAYLAGAANKAGYTIRFSRTARVAIDVPANIIDLMRQRRRIVYGHVQIWKSMGESPRTLESMLTENPLLSLSILVKTLSKSPGLALALPAALIGEVVSVLLALHDNLTATKRHLSWERFGTRS